MPDYKRVILFCGILIVLDITQGEWFGVLVISFLLGTYIVMLPAPKL